MAKNRWELEEKRKQKALAAMQAALKSGAAYKGNAVQQTVSSPVNPKTAQSTLNTARSQSSAQRSSSGSGGGNPASTSRQTTTTRSNTLPGLEALPSFGSLTLRTPSASAQRQNYLSGASERRRTNVDSRTGRSRAMDERDLQLNMARWHNTNDEAERQRLNRENDAIRARLGLSYDPRTGVTYNARTGRNYSLPTQLLYGGTAAQRARAANQFPYSREAAGEDADSISMRPTMQQIAAGVGREASGVNAHQVMADLFSRGAEEWSDEDTRNRDAAVQALSDEMDRIMQQYGLQYSESGLGTGAWGMPDMVSDRTAIDRLREAGADETTLAYVQENINLREAANRFGQGAEAAFKRTVGSPKAFIETVQQQAANVAESRENPEYVQLEAEKQQLENQLTSMPSTNYDGSLNQDYLDVYNRLQAVQQRMQELAVQTPVDQNKWGQTMLREAAEAQANATAGLSTVPRFLANQGISIAGNAPGMAASLIPGVGPAVGATLMGVQAAGQRAQELNAQGASPSEALARGISSGLIEAVTEKLPIDTLADILNRGGTDAVRSILRQMGIEATEESASYVMNFASDWAANDPNAEFSFAELAESALGGMVSGGFYGTIGTAGGRAHAGAQTAQETAAAPQVGNYSPMMQNTAQGGIEQSVSPSGFIVPEAKRRRMAAQDAEYAAQIDGVFNGSMPTDRVVSIGDTPDILLSIGATDLPMTMTQSTARKIAFPAGYMGGSHNLGIPALKRLPEQMRDPAAVLRSKTQPDSFVILTEWNDTNGNPVIIALHLDKQGVVDVTNEVASAYGKNNFAALTGENGENVLYTKNNKSIDQILDNRLQLPALLSDDTLVAYSIAQNSGEGKRQEAINEIDLTPATAIRRSTTDGHITMQSGLFNNSIAQNGGEGNPAQPDSQAIGLRLAELDSAMRTAESLLPGPARDARIAEIRAEMERVQAEAAIQEGLREPEPMQPENVDVPVSEAVQYGATPEQAMNEAKVKEGGRIRQALREAHRNIVSGQAEIERFARAQDRTNPKAVNANDLAQINRAANSTVDTIAGTALVDRKGDKIGDSWVDVVGDLTPEQIEQLTLYRLHKHNVDRMSLWERTASQRIKAAADKETLENHFSFLTNTSSAALEDMARNNESKEIREVAREYLNAVKDLDYWQRIRNKPVIAKVNDDGTRDVPYTADESANIVREMEEQNPQLREWAEKAEQFHDEFMQEWAVGSGLMSQEQYDRLKERYPHYVQTYRVRDNWGGGADTTRRGTVNTGSPIKEAVGDLSEIIPFEDAEMMQVNTIVKNARRNELFRNIYDFAKANPAAAAPYVRVVGEDAEYQAPEDIDDLTGRISDAAMSDAGGIYTIRAMVDGKPVTMQVNSAFYAGLQNLFRQDRGAAEGAISKTIGKLATGFKRVTTGDNPGFFITNFPKDAQTAYFNTISKRKLAVTYLYDVARSAAHMAQNADDWKAFSALGGKSSTFYDNNKGFEKSLEISKRNKKGVRKFFNTLHKGITWLNENAESIWRFNEYRAGIERYGDTPEGRAKAIQAAADVTTNFSRSAPVTKFFDSFVPYLNASIQGLDKTARQIKNHPFTTTRRALELCTIPTLVLWMINKDDEDYQDLNNRTKDNYFCVPAVAFDFIAKPLGLETEGKFIKIPKSREYGVVFGAAFERAMRAWMQGEDIATAFKGLGSQLMTNLAPSNPVTDNIFADIYDLKTNRDFAGRAIVPERMQGLSPENQYDYSTSGAGRTLANIWNATVGQKFGKVSPIQVDYLIDSNLGFIGDAIIGATTQPKSPQQMIEEIRNDPVGAFFAPFLNTLEQKFVADPMYQSGVTDAFYDELNAAEMAKNDKNLVEGLAADIVTPEEKYYSELLKASSEMSELRKQERALMADTSLTDDEREEQVRAIRRQINDIAKAAPENARKVREEYEKTYVPEISYLSESRYPDAQEALQHGVTGQQFAQWDKRLSELTNEKGTDDKKVRTEAEARNIVLDEVMQDSMLSDSEKQAIADYVIISSIGEEDEKTREDWETIAKGKVNASDFVRFQADASVYDDWAEGTGTDNAANVAAILRGYDGLTDEERDVLFQTYRENMSVNPFHVSVYEKSIDPNGSFYGALTDDGKARLRSLLNEYEQDINEGTELSEWRAKAYMAEKEAGISPATYAMYRVALETANTDGKGNPRQSEAEACVNAMDGLTQYQKAYLYASTNSSWKNNPFGSATVGEYSSGQEVGINPVAGAAVTSRFGPRDSFQTDNGAMSSSLHPSIDIGAAEGTPIGAYKSGKVTQNGWVNGYGWTIEVTHSDGTVSAYHHMMEQSPVAVGTEVKQGEQIGKVGQTGNSKGAHLDLTITRDGKPIDPATLIPELQDSATGYVWTGSNVYTNVTSGSSQSSGSSGGSSGSSGLKSLDNLLKLDGLF